MTMRRNIFFILLTITLLFINGCQAIPHDQSVVNKDIDFYNHAIFATQPEDEIMPQFVSYTKNFNSSDGSVQFQIDLHQELLSTKMPVIKVNPKNLTSKDIQRVAESLLSNAVFYEREPSSNPQYSKSQYQEMIARLSPYANIDAMTDLVGNEDAEEMLTSVKTTIAWITEQMETAPDENPHKLCDWTLKKEREYNDTEWDIGQRPLIEDNDWLVATAEKDGFGYKYMVVSRNQDDYKLNRFSIQLGGASVDTYTDRLIYWSKLCRTDAPTQSQIDLVQNKVMEILGQMDLGQWRIADTQVEIYGTEACPEFMLRVYAVPVFNNIPVVYGQQNVSKSNDFTGAYVLTDASFLMSVNGDLIEMQLNSPLDVESIVNEKDFSKLEKYAITPPYSSAIDLFFEKLTNKNYKFAKGQVIGAFTWGTSICDGDLQCSFYDETCREILIKAVTLKAVWQIQKMKEINPDITPILFFDEPVMSQYGTSAFVTVQRDELVDAFSEVVKVVKDFGALSAIHCCGKSDWSVLIDSGVDIINLDAYFFAKSLVPYAKKIEKFLKTGGYIAWGIVPTLDADALSKITLEKLVEIYEDALNALEEKGLTRDLVIDRSIFTPSCGAGSLSMELADKAMSLVNNLSNQLSTGGLLCR